MDDTKKEAVLDAENALREYMMDKRADADAVLMEDHWQGIMVTLALDVATSGLPQDEAISTLLALGWIAGRFHDDPEFQTLVQSFPSANEVQEFWTAKVDEVVERAKEDLLRRPGEEA